MSEECGADLHAGARPTIAAELTPEQIERAKADGKRYGEAPGLYVTVVMTIMEEYGITAEEALGRAAVEYRSDGADGDIEAAAGKYFAGIWLGPEKYTVGVTEGADVEAVEAALEKHGLLEDSEVVILRSTSAEVERAEARIEAIVFGDPYGRELSTDVTGNCVVATVAMGFPDEQVDAIEAIGEELGVAVFVDRIDETAGPPNETGVVVQVEPERVLEQPAGEECRTWISASDQTEVLHASGEPAAWSDLAVGMTIDVWIAGAVQTSCPAGAGAAKIVLRD